MIKKINYVLEFYNGKVVYVFYGNVVNFFLLILFVIIVFKLFICNYNGWLGVFLLFWMKYIIVYFIKVSKYFSNII